MALIYDEQPRKGNGAFKIDAFNATRQYLKHYGNYMFLKFMLANGNRAEKQDASKELGIAEKKMAFWKKAPNFDPGEAALGERAMKLQWAAK
jgi:hypothetical protein